MARRPALNVVRLEDRTTPTPLVGLSNANSLLHFDSATPGTITDVAITGLNVGESVLGIDFRPATGELFGITSQNRLLTINAAGGAATLVAALAADPSDGTSPFTSLNGTSFGFDFNPVVDRIRVVSDANQNLRINPTNGLVITDTDLNPGTPDVVASAYSNNFAGTTTTTLFGLDDVADRLVIQNPPNNGTLTTVGTNLGAGIDVTLTSGFDIVTTGGPSLTNTAVASMSQGAGVRLFAIDLTSGVATVLGTIGGGTIPLQGLAVVPAGTLNFSVDSYAVNENGGTATITVTRTGGSAGAVNVDFATTGLSASAGADFTTTTGTLNFADGDTVPKTFTVNILDDLVPEPNETVRLALSNATGGSVIGATGFAQLNLRDNESPADVLIGVDVNNKTLITFDASGPGTLLGNVAITGLNASDILAGIDTRPATGQLYALVVNGSAGRLVTIDPATGAAVFVAALAADPADATNPFTFLSGGDFGFDFNPTNDRIRITSDADENLLVNPDTGLVTTQTNLNPGAPNVVGSAYTNSFAGAGSTTLFAIDSTTDQVFIQNPPGNGTLVSVGSLGVNVIDNAGFEISAFGNEAFAVLIPAGITRSQLFSINLSTGAATLLGTVGSGFILNGLTTAAAPPPIVPSVSVNDVTVDEAGGTATFTVSLSVASASTVSVNFATANGSALDSEDFSATNGTLTFAPGETSKTITVPITDDSTDEPVQTFSVTLSSPSGATIADGSGVGSINDNDNAPTVSVSDDTVTEGGNLNFSVSLSAASQNVITVFAETNDGSAVSPGDFGFGNVLLTFNPGQTSVGVIVSTADDAFNESPETMSLSLSNPVNVTIADGNGTGVLNDNDAVPTVTIFGTPTVDEGGIAVHTVTLSAASGKTVTVDVQTAAGSAAAGSDFTTVVQTLTFAPGETVKSVSVPTTDDTLDEVDESYSISIANPSNATLGGTVSDTGTILDDDDTPVNTPPTISNTGNQSAIGPIGPIGITVGDAESALSLLSVSGSSNFTSLFPAGSIFVSGTGASRQVLLVPTAGVTGSAVITLTVTDPDGLTASVSFTATVLPPPPPPPPANIPPQISDVGPVAVPFGGFSGVVPFFVSDSDAPATSLTVSASSNNPALVADKGVILGGTGTNRTFVISPNAGQTGTATITLTVSDGKGGTATDTFNVSVAAPASLPAPPAGVTVFESAGANAAGIQASVDAFRAAIGGGTTPGAAGSFGGIRREINWDAVPATKLNPFPGDFFNVNSKRGVLLSTNGTGLAVSGDIGTAQFEFADVTAQQWGPIEFSSFSSPKLFAPLGSNTYDVEFRVAGTLIPAGVHSFGVVFTDVDLANVSKLEFFDAAGQLILTRDVLPTGVKSEGLSFLGVTLPAGLLAAKVRVTTGNAPIDSPFAFPPPDGVAVDDFIFSEPRALPADVKTDLFAVGTGPGVEAQVNVFNNDASFRFALFPFPGFTGGVNVTTGDVTGDGFEDVAVGAGPGGGPHVRVFDGKTGQEVHSFFAYDESFRGGVFVGLGDATGDLRADLVVGAGVGGGPHVKVFDGQNLAELHSFFAYDPDFRGGVTVRLGDVSGDGFADIVTGAGPGGGPHVRVFDGRTRAEIQSFFAGDPDSRGGVFVGVADFNNTGNFLVTASANGRVFAPGYIEQDNAIPVPTSPGNTRVPVAAIRLDTGIIAILIGAAPGTRPSFKIVDGTSNTVLREFAPFGESFAGGVFVG